jgi:hypothetical protein
MPIYSIASLSPQRGILSIDHIKSHRCALLAPAYLPSMHSSFTRLQNVFGFFTTVAFALGAFIAATDLGSPRFPSGVLKTDNIQVYVKLVQADSILHFILC